MKNVAFIFHCTKSSNKGIEKKSYLSLKISGKGRGADKWAFFLFEFSLLTEKSGN